MNEEHIKAFLEYANGYAKLKSTCRKTAVGCLIIKESAFGYHIISKGANSGMVDCRKVGCLRVQLFGDNSKVHRDTCRCRHSEINALRKAKESVIGATAIVTRYPCDNCAKAIVEAGIKRVIYGREFKISEFAEKLFADNNIEVIHISDWNCDKKDTNN